jgi:hypothetical protein
MGTDLFKIDRRFMCSMYGILEFSVLLSRFCAARCGIRRIPLPGLDQVPAEHWDYRNDHVGDWENPFEPVSLPFVTAAAAGLETSVLFVSRSRVISCYRFESTFMPCSITDFHYYPTTPHLFYVFFIGPSVHLTPSCSVPCNQRPERKPAFSFVGSTNRVHNDEGSGRD